jgi:transcriptional regulator with XRE-family HTH domain
MPPVPTVQPDGPAIRRLRTRRGWNPSDLGSRIGRHAKSIARLERGGRASEVLICQVANVLGVEPSEIILSEPTDAIREHLPSNGDGGRAA